MVHLPVSRRAVVIAAAILFILLTTMASQVTLAQEFEAGCGMGSGPQESLVFGMSLMRFGNFEKAVEVFTDIIDAYPDYASAFAGRGIAYYYLEDVERAVDDSLAALELREEYATPYWTLGNIYFDAEDYENALEAYLNYLEYASEYVDPEVVERVEVCQGWLAVVMG